MSDDKVISGPIINIKFSNHFNKTLSQYLIHFAKIRLDNVLMINGVTQEKLSVNEMLEKSFILAAHLQLLGCKPGSVVGIICDNKIEFVILTLAIILVGAVVTSFNPLYTTGELRHTFGISQPFLIFTLATNLEKISQLKQEFSSVKFIIVIDGDCKSSKGISLNALLSDSNVQYKNVHCDLDDVVMILYSSGTTGLPKGVQLTHRNIVHVLEVTRQGFIPTVFGDYGIGVVPMFHGYGMLVNFLSLTIGFGLIVMQKFNLEHFCSYIEKYKVKFLYMVPTLMVAMSNSPMINSYNLSSVEEVVSGGASLSMSVIENIKNKLNLKAVYLGYGLTETAFSALQCRRGITRTLGTCGQVLPGMQCKVVNPETGESLGFMEKGELYFKGPNIMKCYHNDEKTTKDTIDSKGWFHSGDTGYYDEDYNFFIIDRARDIIKYNCYQVSPSELENLLMNHDYIIDAAVVGIPDEKAGELPKSFVVKVPGSKLTENDVIQYIAELVSPQKWLRGGVTFVDEIPRNLSGKILRRQLKSWVKSKL